MTWRPSLVCIRGMFECVRSIWVIFILFGWPIDVYAVVAHVGCAVFHLLVLVVEWLGLYGNWWRCFVSAWGWVYFRRFCDLLIVGSDSGCWCEPSWGSCFDFEVWVCVLVCHFACVMGLKVGERLLA